MATEINVAEEMDKAGCRVLNKVIELQGSLELFGLARRLGASGELPRLYICARHPNCLVMQWRDWTWYAHKIKMTGALDNAADWAHLFENLLGWSIERWGDDQLGAGWDLAQRLLKDIDIFEENQDGYEDDMRRRNAPSLTEIVHPKA